VYLGAADEGAARVRQMRLQGALEGLEIRTSSENRPETGVCPEQCANELGRLAAPSCMLLPRRGLILAHNSRGQYFREKDLHRWVAYCARVMNCSKIDVLAWGPIPGSVETTIQYAREFDVPISLRTDGSDPPDGLDCLAAEGLADVFLCPRYPGESAWFGACHRLGLPIRLQLQLPHPGDRTAPEWAGYLAEHGVRSVNLVLEDPFQPIRTCADAAEGKAVLDFVNALAVELPNRGIEANLFGFPPELLTPESMCCAGDERAFFLDHQQYDRRAYNFARHLFPRRSETARTALLLELKRHTVAVEVSDQWVTKTLFVRAKPIYHWGLYIAKLWRAWRGTPVSRNLRGTRNDGFGAQTHTSSAREQRRARQLLGGYSSTCVLCASAKTPSSRPRYFDHVDQRRLRRTELWRELAQEAREWERQSPPTRIAGEDQWGADRTFMVPEYGATGWLTFLSGERVSTWVDECCPPFMVSVTAGGGLAEAVGFRLTASCKLMCPFVEPRHTITLYVREDGRYVLLRDGVPVEPIHLPGEYPAPERAPSIAKVHVVAWDIDARISYAPLRLWKGQPPVAETLPPPRYSVVIFCTRFARRLAAVLECLAHQCDFDLSRLEIIVGYVPGMDATEDVLDSIRLTHPELRVVHATFPLQNARSKGYVLNQCMAMAAGEWIILLDADTLLPPNMFTELERLGNEPLFVFPQGRVMLTPETTARILLGELEPWSAWDDLLAAAPEIRENEAKGAPIGYCQCFRRTCLEQVRYPEYEHFQGADFEFAMALRKHYGIERRLSFPVLHMDHSGSQWFGAERHF
jgi:hypothetical protein